MKTIVAAVLVVNGPWILALAMLIAAVPGAGWLGAVTGLGASVALFVVARRGRWGGGAVVAASAGVVAAVVLPALMSTKVVDAVAIVTRRIPVVPLADVTDTPLSVVSIDGARVDLTRLGESLSSRGGGAPGRVEQGHDTYAAPIVNLAGEGAGPVWLACTLADDVPAEQTERRCRAHMSRTPITGRIHRATRGDAMVEPDAVAAAREAHGVDAPTELVIVETTDDLRGWGVLFVIIGAAAVLVINLLGLALVRWVATAASAVREPT